MNYCVLSVQNYFCRFRETFLLMVRDRSNFFFTACQLTSGGPMAKIECYCQNGSQPTLHKTDNTSFGHRKLCSLVLIVEKTCGT